MAEKLVVIPTYNEKENIEKITRKVFSLEGEFHILVVDDGSPDGTADIVKGLQAEFPERLHLIQRNGKQGLGYHRFGQSQDERLRLPDRDEIYHPQAGLQDKGSAYHFRGPQRRLLKDELRYFR